MFGTGVVDFEGQSISDETLTREAMNSLLKTPATDGDEQYTVRRGDAFVNEYARKTVDGELCDGGPTNPNHLLGAFPMLFPYGRGGFETSRPRPLAYVKHIRWALQYADGRFRKNSAFVCNVFSVSQKRRVATQSRVQIRRSNYERLSESIARLTPKILAEAAVEEERGIKFTNPDVQSLWDNITSTRSRVMATDESRSGYRSKMWSMMSVLNPPSFWITINPNDTHDPIAQIFAGEEIDMDNFMRHAGPEPNDRARTIASDPYSAAKFFYFIVEVIIEELLGIRAATHGRKIRRQRGILGTVSGYFGTVEAQGRGTLHLHMLVWLKGAPPAVELKGFFASDVFRERVRAFIDSTVRAHIPDLDEETLDNIAPDPYAAYNRPPDPRSPNFSVELKEREKILVRTLQLHTCTQAGCLRRNWKGKLVCKRRAPFEFAPTTLVEPNGHWCPQRFLRFLNNWNPTILLCLQGNHDVKFITNGEGTKHIIWYITAYATKKQGKSYNASALISKNQQYLLQTPDANDQRDQNQRLINRCVNTLSRQQELSMPQMISYLMDWGDHVVSHRFENVYLSGVTYALNRTFPKLLDTWPKAKYGYAFTTEARKLMTK